MIKIDLITGFLGAGKTSFIQKYVKELLKEEQRIGIIESDYGAINIDLMLLQDLEEAGCDLEMVIGGNSPADHQRRLRSKLISMAMLGYNRIIVEPSGIYDVDEFFDLLHEEPLDRWYEIGNVITLLDARLHTPLSNASSYMLVSQAASAGAIVLSRTQLASPEELASTLSALEASMQDFQCKKAISPILFDKDWSFLTEEDWQKLLSCGYSYADYRKLPLSERSDYTSLFFMKESYPPLALPAGEVPDLDVISEKRAKRFARETLAPSAVACDIFSFRASAHPCGAFLSHRNEVFYEIKKSTENIFSDASCGNVIRIKGFFSLPNSHYLQLNASRQDFSLKEVKRGQEVLIVIGENLNQAEIQKHLLKLS